MPTKNAGEKSASTCLVEVRLRIGHVASGIDDGIVNKGKAGLAFGKIIGLAPDGRSALHVQGVIDEGFERFSQLFLGAFLQ